MIISQWGKQESMDQIQRDATDYCLLSNDLHSLKVLLADIIKDIEEGKSINGYLAAIQDYLYAESLGDFNHPRSIYVYGSNKSISFLVAHQLSVLCKVDIVKLLDNKTEKKTYVAYLPRLRHLQIFLDEYNEDEQKSLTTQKIWSLLKVVNSFGALSLISGTDNKLCIYSFDCTHKKYNSQCFNGGIVVSATRPEKRAENHPDYIFMHEIGHQLQFSIMDATDVPESFIPIFEMAFNNNYDYENKNDMSEVFADCFSIAVSCQNKRLKSINPFYKKFGMFDIQLISYYFKEVCRVCSPQIIRSIEQFWTNDRLEPIRKTIVSVPELGNYYVEKYEKFFGTLNRQ